MSLCLLQLGIERAEIFPVGLRADSPRIKFLLEFFLCLRQLKDPSMCFLLGLALVLYTVVVWKFDGFRDDVNVGAGRLRITGLLRPAVLILIPIAVGLVLLTSLGLIR